MKPPKFYGWVIRTMVCLGALVVRNPIDRTTIILWTLAAAGAVMLGAAQAADAGVSFGRLLGTPLGRALWWRALPIGAAAAMLGVAAGLPARARRRQRLERLVTAVSPRTRPSSGDRSTL